MSSRKPKDFPPGTFIPVPQRLMAITQLCLAFSLLLWYGMQPFMGEHFALRSRMLIYEYVMGTSPSQKNSEIQKKHANYFEKLPEREKLLTDYQQLQTYAKRPFLQKLEGGIRGFIQQVPPFEQAWIYFSIVISIILLLKREGAKQAAWLLPLIAVAFAVDNIATGKRVTLPPDASLFPTEEVIVQNYLKEPLGTDLQTQKEQLERGWKLYLVDNWAPNKEEAEYKFTVARLNLLHSQPLAEWLNSYHEKLNPFVLLIYFLWNVAFACIVSRPVTRLA